MIILTEKTRDLKRHLKDTLKSSYILLFLVGLSISGCNPIPLNHVIYTPYTVPKGMHECYELPLPIPTNLVSFSFKTNDTWYWPWRDNDDNDISKVGGIYWGQVHDNSVRLGVRRLQDGLFQFWYYIYENGVSPQEDKDLKGVLFETYALEDSYQVISGYSSGSFKLEVLGHGKIERQTEFRPDRPAGFAFPYFGGNNTAPNKWVVPILLL